jgi:hypothetical protein
MVLSTNSFMFTYKYNEHSVNDLYAFEHLVPKAESWELGYVVFVT